MNKELETLEILRDNHIEFMRERYGKLDIETYQNIINRKLARWNILEQALKRNEPVKLLKEKKYLHDDLYMLFGKCPVCNHYNLFTSNYCSNCGQALEKIEKEE